MANFQKVKVGDLLEKVKGQKKVPKGDYLAFGKYKIIDQGDSESFGFCNDPDLLYKGPMPVIIFGDHTCRIKFIKTQFCLGADGTQLMFTNKIDQTYFYYALKGLSFKISAYQRHYKLIKEKTILYPEKKEAQIRIASVLSAYDDLIENNEKRIKALEEMAQLLYTEWFVKFNYPRLRQGFLLRNCCGGQVGGQADNEKMKMVDSGTEYGMVPEGWVVKMLDDLIQPQYGFTTSAIDKTAGVQFLRGMDINKTSYIDWSSVPYCDIEASNNKKYAIKKGDIFIIRMADPGKIGICEKQVDAVFASYLMRLQIKSRLTNYYLFYYLISNKYQNFVVGSSSGTTRKSINSKQVGTINILVPDQNTLENFEEKISLLRSRITNHLDQNQNLTKTRDLLIPQLVTGKRILKGL